MTAKANTLVAQETKQEAAEQESFRLQLAEMADYLSFCAPQFAWHNEIAGFEEVNLPIDADSDWGLLLAITEDSDTFDAEWMNAAFTGHCGLVGNTIFNSTAMKFARWQDSQIYLSAVAQNLDVMVQISPCGDTEVNSRTTLFELINHGYSEGLVVWIDGEIQFQSGDIEPKKIELINLAEAA